MGSAPRESGEDDYRHALDDYSTAIGAAFLMAQGIEGDAVVRVIRTGVKSSVELRESLSEAGLRAVEKAEVEAEERSQKIRDALDADDRKRRPRHPDQPVPIEPWAARLRGWSQLGRGFDEFWRLSPAQIDFVLMANSDQKSRRGTAKDLMGFAAAGNHPRTQEETTGSGCRVHGRVTREG